MEERFYCKFTDPFFSRYVEYSNARCETIEDIKSLISYVLRVGNSQFIIENPPKPYPTRQNLKGYEFKITIKSRCTDIEFQLPDRKIYKVINGYKMKVPEIMAYLEQNGLYISYNCKNKNLFFTISGREALHAPYPFFAVPIGTQVNIIMSKAYAILEYDQKVFIFNEGEFAHEAYNAVNKKFEKFTKFNLISIMCNDTHQKLPGGYALKGTEQYKIRLMCPVDFRNKSDTKYHSYMQFDYFTKISGAKQRMAPIFSINKINVQPWHIFIYDKDKNEITDDDKFLREIRDSEDKVLFDIDFNRKPKPKPKENPPAKPKQEEKAAEKPKQEDKSTAKPNKPPETQKDEKAVDKSLAKSDKTPPPKSPEPIEDKKTEGSKLSEKSDSLEELQRSKKPKTETRLRASCRPKIKKPDAEAEQENENKEEPKDKSTKRKETKDSDTENESAMMKSKANPKQETQNKKPEPTKDSKPDKSEVHDEQAEENKSQVKIHFVFEGSKEEEDSSFDEYFDEDTTVNEIESKLKTKIGKEDKITLEYEDREDGEKISLGRKMKINNILEDIKTETKEGQPIYILYIKIKKPAKSTRPIKPKISKTADSSSDSDSKRKPKKKTETKSSDSDDDTSKSSKKQNNKNRSSPSKRKSSIESDSESDSDIKRKPKKKTKAESSDSDDDTSKSSKKQNNKNRSPPSKRKSSIESDSDSESVSKRKPKKKTKAESSDSDDDTSELSRNQNNKNRSPPSKRKSLIESDSESDSKRKPKKKTKAESSDSDDDTSKSSKKQNNKNRSPPSKRKSSIESDSESEEEVTKPSKKTESKKAPKPIKSYDDDDDDDDEEHSDSKQATNGEAEEEEKPSEPITNIQVTSGKYKYFYQTNREDEIQEIEFDAGTSVKEMKQIIAEKNDVDCLANIKVIFAGKDLLNELILDDLEIGDIPLYVYIRSTEDILLMTAKALVIKKEDLYASEEEEEEAE